MKKFVFGLAMLALVMSVPVSSYAIVDAAVYGGYSYANLDTDAYQENMNGWEYGFWGHLNFGLPMLFSVGVGPFYQKTATKYDVGGTDYDADRVMWGIDVMASLELPIFIHPYIRMGIAIKEELQLDQSGGTLIKDEKYFNSHYYGIGAAFSVFPMVRLFGEYVFNYSNQEDNTVIKSNAVHVGAMLSI